MKTKIHNKAAERALKAVDWMNEHHPDKCATLNSTFDWSILRAALAALDKAGA